MVDSKEIKCYEYICSIRDIESLGCVGLYNLDKFREEIHNELCELFGLEKIETKKFTDNIDTTNAKAAEILYLNLLEVERIKKTQ